MFGTVKQYLSELVPDSRERLISEVVIFITREQSGECDFLLILRNLLLLSLDQNKINYKRGSIRLNVWFLPFQICLKISYKYAKSFSL